jgi:hypothetical protein
MAASAPKSLFEVALAYGRAFDRAIAAKPDDKNLVAIRNVLFAKDSPTDLPADKIDQFFNRADDNEVKGLKSSIDKYRATSVGAHDGGYVFGADGVKWRYHAGEQIPLFAG